MSPKTNTLLAGRYRVLGPLGEGGMGEVLEVEDTRAEDRHVALKILSQTNPRWEELFRREFALLAASRHPNIVPVFDYGIEPERGAPFYTAALIRGESVRSKVGRWSEEELIDLIAEVARALAFLHSRGIIHGDVKPANILKSYETKHYVLVDFGLAYQKGDGENTLPGGTPFYMAPEVVFGKSVDERVDLYSLGRTILRLAMGRHSHPDTKDSDPRLRGTRPEFSPAFEEIVARLTERNPDARFQSAPQVIEALNRSFNRKIPLETPETLRAYAAAPHLIGREEALFTVLSVLNERPRGVAIEGALGMGKSRFLEEVRRKLQLTGENVLLFHARPEAASFTNLLTEWSNAWMGTKLPDPLLESEGGGAEGGDLNEALMARILRSRPDRPMTLLLDDADRFSPEARVALVSFFRRLAESPEIPLALVVTCEALSSLGHLRPWFKRLALDPLTKEDVGAYLRLFSDDVHKDVVAAAWAHSAGIPLLLEAIVQPWLLKADDLAKPETAARISKLDFAAEAKGIFEQKIAGVTKKARAILEFLSAAEGPVPRGALPGEVPEELFHARLVRSEGAFGTAAVAVTNPAVRVIALEALSEARRKALHSEVAKRFVAWLGSRQEITLRERKFIAEQWLRSDTPAKGIDHLCIVLEALQKVHGTSEAEELIELVLPLLRSKERSPALDVLRSLATDILARVGKYEDGLTFLRVLLATAGEEKPVLLRRIADLHLKIRDLPSTLKTVAECEALLSSWKDPRRAAEGVRLSSIRQICALLKGDMASVEAIGKAIEASGTTETHRERILSFTMRGHAARAKEKWPVAATFYRTALRESERSHYLSGVSMALGSLALVEQARKKPEGAMELYEKAIEMAEKASDLLAMATHHLNIARLCETRGEYARALRSYERAVELYERLRNRSEYAVALYRFAKFLAFLGVSADVPLLLERSLALFREARHELNAAFTLVALARGDPDTETAAERLSEARGIFERLKESFGVREVSLTAIERRLQPATALEWKDLHLDQKLRLLAAEFGTPAGREGVSAKLDEKLKRTCREDANPEWLARFYILEAQMKRSQGFGKDARRGAEKGLKLLHKLSAPLGEAYQAPYLASRGVIELKKMVQESEITNERPPTPSQDLDSASGALARKGIPADMLGHLLELLRDLNGENDLTRLAARLVDAMTDLTNADRGFLAIARKEKERGFDILSARGRTGGEIRDPVEQFSRSVVRETLRRGEKIRHGSPGASSSWSDHPSVFASGAKVFLAVPILSPAGAIGVLYVDRKSKKIPFDATESLLAEALAEQTSAAIHRLQMTEEIRFQKERLEHLNRQLEMRLEKSTDELSTVRELLKVTNRRAALASEFPNIVGQSQRMLHALEQVEQAARSEAPVYIYGESGTGKELIARALHDKSPRKKKHFVPVNCSAVPADLFESAFFGHEKGAFTGADSQHRGYFTMADGGTLFLDEIDSLSADRQAKLLRVLEDGKIRPVGATEEKAISARLVLASNRNLEALVREGKFREDFYYRAVVIRIDLPSLRERLEDIPLLAEHFARDAAKRVGIPKPVLGDDVITAFMNREWPGNVRQLRNEIERMVIMLPKTRRKRLKVRPAVVEAVGSTSRPNDSEARLTLTQAYDRIALELVTAALTRNQGNKSRAAKELGITRRGLKQILRRLAIDQVSDAA